MRILRTVAEMREPLARPQRIGLFPTMGALHDGHVALVRAARLACDHIVATIFVNPGQFNDPADLAAYPRQESRDTEILEPRASIRSSCHPSRRYIRRATPHRWLFKVLRSASKVGSGPATSTASPPSASSCSTSSARRGVLRAEGCAAGRGDSSDHSRSAARSRARRRAHRS